MELLTSKLLQPIVLACLLFSLGTRGGCELAKAGDGAILPVIAITVSKVRELVRSVIRGPGILLRVGGMVIGYLATDKQRPQIQPFYEGLFRRMLMPFLLEVGITAARQARAFRDVGLFMVAFGMLMPLANGLVGVTLGHWAGLSTGGALVFGAICASASFIDAPAACRASLPEANPGIYLTSSLGVTPPFILLLGLPLHYQYTAWLVQ